jgi:SMODS and SLOG-associating 2TM effector domain 1
MTASAPQREAAPSAVEGGFDGRIPMPLRIGVTGHRRLDNEAALAQRVREGLGLISARFPASDETPVHFVVLSELAEGADRLVVQEARSLLGDDRLRLVAVLPLARHDYVSDFAGAASREEFDAHLQEAMETVQIPVRPETSREDAYRQAGREVVDRSDVLLAIWDGQPAQGTGGTAEVVDYARDAGVSVLIVPASATGPLELHEPEKMNRARDALRRLHAYNGDDPALAALEVSLRRTRAWRPEPPDATVRRAFETLAKRALPHFARAELLARRYQRRYFAVVDALFALAALAVAAVGWQISFHPDEPRFALIETVALVLLVVAFSLGRRTHLHEAWIGYRSLAEAFRSSVFIAIIGSGDSSAARSTSPRAESWFQRAFSEAWAHLRKLETIPSDVPALRALLADSWVREQLEYHRHAACVAERRHRLVTRLVECLLGIAIVLSILHAFEVFEEHSHTVEDLLEFFAIALPGISAALTGHREHRQYRLNAERSSRTADRLCLVLVALETARDMSALRGLANEAQVIMVEENRDWFGVAELQELEVSL